MSSRLNPLNLLSWLKNQRFPPRRPALGWLIGLGVLVAIAAHLLFFRLAPFSPSQSKVQTLDLPNQTEFFVQLAEEPTTTIGRLISEPERQTIKKILGTNAIESSSLAPGDPPLVIIHDTSGEMSRQTILERQKQYQGPYGNGVATYILRSGEGIITRPQFFTRYRPTATAYEKGIDLLPEKIRNQEARRVWRSLSAQSRQSTLQALAKTLQEELRINGSVLAKRSSYWLDASSENAFEAGVAQQGVTVDGGKTTALWAIADVCNRALSDKQAALELVTSPAAAQALQSSCQRLNPLLEANRERVMGSVNIELLQQQGSECWTTDSGVRQYNSLVTADYLKIRANRVVPLPNPIYTDAQYETLKLIYLKASLEAGRFPAIVTHYQLDQGQGQKIGDHCDPRGLDLVKLYSLISQSLNHSPDTFYGSKPQYGLHPERGDNVWWSERVMGEPPPVFAGS